MFSAVLFRRHDAAAGEEELELWSGENGKWHFSADTITTIMIFTETGVLLLKRKVT